MSEDGVEKILWWLGLVIAPTVLIGIELFHPQGFTEPPPTEQRNSNVEYQFDPDQPKGLSVIRRISSPNEWISVALALLRDDTCFLH